MQKSTVCLLAPGVEAVSAAVDAVGLQRHIDRLPCAAALA